MTSYLFFLNTSGELYSISYLNEKVNWMLNFKSSSQKDDTDIFSSNPIVIKNEKLIITTDVAISNFDTSSGDKNWTFSSNAVLKPVTTTNYTYILSKSNFLICIENKTGNVLWSKNIFYILQEKKIMNKVGKFHDLKIVNNKLNLFSNKGYLLIFNYRNGNLDFIKKISKNGINSKIVFLKDNMFMIDNTNKLLKFN